MRRPFQSMSAKTVFRRVAHSGPKGPRPREGEPYRAIGTAYRYRAADVSIKRRACATPELRPCWAHGATCVHSGRDMGRGYREGRTVPLRRSRSADRESRRIPCGRRLSGAMVFPFLPSPSFPPCNPLLLPFLHTYPIPYDTLVVIRYGILQVNMSKYILRGILYTYIIIYIGSAYPINTLSIGNGYPTDTHCKVCKVYKVYYIGVGGSVSQSTGQSARMPVSRSCFACFAVRLYGCRGGHTEHPTVK